jgi:hypothetical protein
VSARGAISNSFILLPHHHLSTGISLSSTPFIYTTIIFLLLIKCFTNDLLNLYQIWVSSKREDADRKLGLRINQEMMVLPHAETTFVIISSDQDFRHYYQLLNSAGYEVVVVHNAGPGPCAKWVQVLEMHAHKAYRWCDIMNGAIKSGDEVLIEGQVDVIECVNSSREEEETPLKCDENIVDIRIDNVYTNGSRRGSDKDGRMSNLTATDGQIARGRIRTKKKPYSTTIRESSNSVCVLRTSTSNNRQAPRPPADSGHATPPVPAPTPVPNVELGWAEGTVIRWRGTFGFLAVRLIDCPSFVPRSAVPSPVTIVAGASEDSMQKGEDRNRNRDGDGQRSTIPLYSVPPPVERCTALRVYVHYKSLHFDPPVLLLRRGERVRVYVELGSRGYFGGRVEPLILESLPLSLSDVEKSIVSI